MMDSENKEVLLEDVKRNLKITWSNENTEKELSVMIDDAEIYMNHLLGAEIDYSAPGMFHKLFLNYAMYSYNHCENEFEEAYQKDIIRCQNYIEVMNYREECSDDEEETNTSE